MIEYIIALPMTIIPLLCLIWLFKTITEMIRELKELVKEIRKK